MPEFIGRPNIPSDLWQTAIRLAAQRNNPMVEAVTSGAKALGGALEDIGEMKYKEAMAQTAFDRQKKMADYEAQLRARSQYGGDVSRLAGAGQLEPIQTVEEYETPGGIGPTEAYDMFKAEPQADGPSAPTTFDLARAYGIEPTGQEYAIKESDKAARSLADKKALIDYRITKLGLGPGGENHDPEAWRLFNAWKEDQLLQGVDISKEQIATMYNFFLQSVRESKAGTFKPFPEAAPVAPKEPPKGFIQRAIGKMKDAVGSKGKKERKPLSKILE